MIKLATIVGARPQFIKAAAVSRAIQMHIAGGGEPAVTEILIHTGQHYDHNMSGAFFDELEISKPAYNLGISQATHAEMTGRMLEEIETVLVDEAPDAVIVYGDTNTTLAGALAAAKLPMTLAHVEAGLRSFDDAMPEETNRIVADRLSDLLFAPHAAAAEHLRREGTANERIYVVGDVMYDAALHYAELAAERSRVLDHFDLRPGSYGLVTVHRADNVTDTERMRGICTGIKRSAETVPMIWPLHPRTRAALEGQGVIAELGAHVRLVDPVGYLDMITLEQSAAVILTDSGGVQKEAAFYRVPCVVLRDQTEWVELIESGAAVLGGADADTIAMAVPEMMQHKIPVAPFYGDGHAAEAIFSAIMSYVAAQRTGSSCRGVSA
jgi:UDP-GlcNAc3NAcA epimerase